MPPRTIIHVRHGETPWNVEKRLQGWRDIPLNDTGRAQARRNGPVLAQELVRLGLDADAIAWVASPLMRARETMETVRRGAGLDPAGYRTDDRLKEISYGIYEGFTHAEIEAKAPDDFAGLMADKWSFRPRDGENYHDLKQRVSAAIDAIGGDCVIVSHGGILRILRSLAERREDREIVDFVVPQDQIYVWHGEQAEWV